MKFVIVSAFLLLSSLSFAEWKSDSEAGYVSQSGNTEQNNAFARSKITSEFGKNSIIVNGEYINNSGTVSGTDQTLAESSVAGVKYLRNLTEKLALTASFLWEKNRFSGFDNRYSFDLGVRYDIIKGKDFYLFNETGYRHRLQYAHTIGPMTGDKTLSDFVRVYFEIGKTLSETMKFNFWIENLIDMSDSDNYELNYQPSVDISLGKLFGDDQKARISLRIAYKGMFDNVPAQNGLKKYDSIFSTGINVVY